MDKPQVPNLDGRRDFFVWRVQVRSSLEARNWFGIIGGSFVGINENAREWTRAEAKEKAVILNTIQKAVFHPEMWGRLRTLESRSTLSVSLLRQEFYSYRMTATMDMSTRNANVESMVQRPSDLGKVMEDDEVTLFLRQKRSQEAPMQEVP